MRILVLNAGSSSLKASVIDDGQTRGRTTVDVGDDASRSRGAAASVEGALDELALDGMAIDAVGHRVVHGGARFTQPLLVDDEARDALEELATLAPLHNPVALQTIAAARRLMPGVPQVAVFDTAFHATLPIPWQRYPVPAEWHERWGVRRYGFHGLSVAWSVRRSAELLGRPQERLRLVVAHLGNGCSVTAVDGGRSAWTSMGMTPLEGLMMGTRSGSIDPGIIVTLLRNGQLELERLTDDLEHRSGLLGVSGVSADVRDLTRAADAGDERARLALEMFVVRAAAAIGSAATAVPTLDAVVFTGGIGENATTMRARIVGRLGVVGVAPIDGAPEPEGDGPLGAAGDGPRVMRIVAREDLIIADEVERLLGVGSALP